MDTKIIQIDPRELKLLERNARYMPNEEYSMLVENVKRDGKLTSVPFAILDGDKYKVLSGNHRVMASIDAGLEEITLMVTHDELSEEQQIAIQLSHNSIAGQDDPAILKELYESIVDIDLKKYSGLDDKSLELIASVSKASLTEASLDFKSLFVMFLPDELEEAKRVIDLAMEQAGKRDEIWVARNSEYDRWLDNVELASASYGVKNVATALDIIFELFERHKDELKEGWEALPETNWVPIESALGRANVPVALARELDKAIQIAKGRHEKKDSIEAFREIIKEYIDRE